MQVGLCVCGASTKTYKSLVGPARSLPQLVLCPADCRRAKTWLRMYGHLLTSEYWRSGCHLEPNPVGSWCWYLLLPYKISCRSFICLNSVGPHLDDGPSRDEVTSFISSLRCLFVWPHNVLWNRVISLLLTHSMVQSPSWEANRFSASQEIPHILRTPKGHYRTH